MQVLRGRLVSSYKSNEVGASIEGHRSGRRIYDEKGLLIWLPQLSNDHMFSSNSNTAPTREPAPCRPAGEEAQHMTALQRPAAALATAAAAAAGQQQSWHRADGRAPDEAFQIPCDSTRRSRVRQCSEAGLPGPTTPGAAGSVQVPG